MKTRITQSCLLISLLALLVGAVQAAPELDAVSFGHGVSFSTDFVYGQAFLRVTGPAGYVHEEHFGSLEDLAFTFETATVDGRYSWEILAVGPISDEVKLRLEKARQDPRIVDQLKASGELSSASFAGSFSVTAGLVEVPKEKASLDDRDLSLKKLFSEDVYIEGDLCVGNDCNNNEPLGSDTIRLKENNVRIHFNDTSSGGFPANDWRIAINDSNSGGDSYFALRDVTGGKTPLRIDAGAPGQALRIKSDGKIGLGTSAPAVDLHIASGNSPALRLAQDGSDGFVAQSWDIAGNEANFFVRDVTNGSKLPFKIRPKAPDDSLVLGATGLVGINEDNAKARLHVRDGGNTHTPTNSAVMALFQRDGSSGDGSIVSVLAGTGGNAQIFLGDKDDDKAGRVIYRNASDAMGFWTSGVERMFIESDGDICIGCNDTLDNAIRHSNGAVLTAGGTWTNASSRSLKQDISELSGEQALATLAGLAPVTYRYKAELDETYVGFIAEDVPELVAMKDRRSLTTMDVVAVLTKVVQEQQAAYQAQVADLEAQRSTIEALRNRLEALEEVE